MNIKIKAQSVRFKISEDELKTLLIGDILAIRLDLPGSPLCARIEPVSSGSAMIPMLQSGPDQINLRLSVPQGHLQKLMDMGRNRDGLREDYEGLSLALQVDFRSDSRRKNRPDK